MIYLYIYIYIYIKEQNFKISKGWGEEWRREGLPRSSTSV